jgi:outer membrane immunogenic protein
MKRVVLLFACGVGIAFAHNAWAADLPVRPAPVYQPPPPVVAPNWTGLYLGVNGGWSWAAANVTTSPIAIAAVPFSPFKVGQDTQGPVFGGQLGYNWQAGSWVFGVEGDVDGVGAQRSVKTLFQPATGSTFSASATPEWLATVRGRVGYVWGPGLIYVTGGGAWSGIQFDTNDGGTTSGSFNTTRSGWTLGGGYEWMFAPNWMLRAEYLYYSFHGTVDGTNNVPAVFGGGAITHSWENMNTSVVRIGLNYKLDWWSHNAWAADLPAAQVYKAPPVVAPNWTGLYLGVNSGWSWASSNVTTTPVGLIAGVFPTFTQGQNTQGPVFGGQLGYNWQVGSWVFGVEGDVDGVGAQRSTKTFLEPVTFAQFSASATPEWLATVRGRIGYAWGPGLIYVTGGGAWSGVQFDANDGGTASGSFNTTRSGWTLGGGYEWMFAPSWMLRAEYLYYSFHGTVDSTNALALLPVAAVAHSWENMNTSVVRIGLNYKLDWWR